ncbi:ankyrin repeat domain-containing protein [Flagellimonas sp.]|jgi:ankyrin repeat protein|uniref:ankyrin repeat domain-containing protein n=1 Tax=Flagellimonas sp. TaxID=2058762 RepID=UPI003BACE3FE
MKKVVFTALLSCFLFKASAQQDTLDIITNQRFDQIDTGRMTLQDQGQWLSKAMENNAVEFFKGLLKAKNCNVHGKDGQTLLLRAVKTKKEEFVSQLLQMGANPNLPELQGLKGTPLMYASSMGSTSMMDVLLDHGANVDQIDVNGDPAINWATFSGNIGAIKLLLDQGADPTISSKHGDAADVAVRMWHQDSVYSVFYGHRKIGPWEDSSKKIWSVMNNKEYQKADKILRKHPHIANSMDPLGIPLLQLAAQKGDVEMVNLFLKYGANPNLKNRAGQTPLAFAARFGYMEVVKLLVDHGADVNLTGQGYRLTPLMGAAVNGSVAIGRYLIEHGADVNTIDIVNECEPMHWAMFYGNLDFIEAMIEAGGDTYKMVLDKKYDAKLLAQAYGYQDVVEKIKQMRRAQLLGSWHVDQIHYQYRDTTYIQKGVDYGRFMFTKNHYSGMYNPNLSPRKPFKDLSKPTEEEIKSGFQSIKFNSGTYSINNGILEFKADMAKVPGFEGGEQFFRITSSKGGLELTMFDENYPDGSKPEWYKKLEIKLILSKE